MMSHLPLPARSGPVLVAVGDPSRDRTVYATIVLLVALGLMMILLAVWLMRSTRPDPEVLAPLERMGQRKWRRADPVWQRRHLDDVRPGGANPLEPMTAPPATDAEFERGPQPIGFDDLVVAGTPVVAVGADLPAPPPGAVAVDGPDGDARRDVSAIDSAGAVDTDDSMDAVSAGEVDEAESGADGSNSSDTPADGDEDDEDITGEQDTDDDFLVALGELPEVDPEVDPVDVEPAAEFEAGPIDEVVAESEVDPVNDPDAGEHDEPG